MTDAAEATVLRTLLVPFRANELPWSGRIAFLRARADASLAELGSASLNCEQSFKPHADALERTGFVVKPLLDTTSGAFDVVLALPPRQREEARSQLAHAVDLAGEVGIVVVAAANNAGARTLESDLERLCGQIRSESKHKCRVFWSRPPRSLDQSLLNEWRQADAPRPIFGGRFISRPGVFAWDRIDPASALLAEELPGTLSGAAADLGAGFGYLSDALLAKCPGINRLDLYEAEARALELARLNLASHERSIGIEYLWHDVTSGLPRKYDVIVSNPPFHTSSGEDDPGLGRRFITAAANALNANGRLYLVANRHLPYEQVLNSSFGTVRILTQRYGFKIIEAVRTSESR